MNKPSRNHALASNTQNHSFGLQDSHAKGMAIQFNYFLDKGAFVADPDGTFHVDFSKIKDAVNSLDREFLTLEATGDYAGTKKMMDQLMNIRPVVAKAIESLKALPTDIEPKFVTADELTGKKIPPSVSK